MQMRRVQLPENFNWQRLAAAGFAKALCGILLSLSCAENRHDRYPTLNSTEICRTMYERRKQPLLSRVEFFKRVGRHGLVALGVLVFGLGSGILGYHFIAHLSWIDSLLNASMIIGGMGPVDPLPNNAAKVFASCYALFSGLAFVGIVSVLLAPFVHRMLHRFHAEEQ
jgi:hypothetical protein